MNSSSAAYEGDRKVRFDVKEGDSEPISHQPTILWRRKPEESGKKGAKVKKLRLERKPEKRPATLRAKRAKNKNGQPKSKKTR
jgi:ribosomal protein S1